MENVFPSGSFEGEKENVWLFCFCIDLVRCSQGGQNAASVGEINETGESGATVDSETPAAVGRGAGIEAGYLGELLPQEILRHVLDMFFVVFLTVSKKATQCVGGGVVWVV